MHPHVDPETAFSEARPDGPAPGTALDIKQVMRDGYRVRRRRRALLGGGAGAAACVLAAVLTLSVTGLPWRDEEVEQFPPGESFAFDPANAGYPGPAPDEPDPKLQYLQESAEEAFGDLAIDSGFLDADALDYEAPSDEEIESVMDEYGIGYQEALSELRYQDLPLQFQPWTSPGNGGQVYLRGYIARDGDEEAEQSSFTITALQPGGWTAEPGPTGDVAFPQHLIDDGASWTDEAPEFTTEELDDGRTLMVADHGCALEAAVVYPNGSALRSTWDVDCEGQGRDLTVDELTDAMLAMPQIDYDTGELQPIDDLLEIPPGWEPSDTWETEADADAQASIAAATEILDTAYPGIELTSSQASQLSATDTAQRTYAAGYTMPFDDTAGYPVHASLRYYLPGGWLPGLPPEGSTAEVYLLDCGGPGDGKDDVCEETEIDGRTVATRYFPIAEHWSLWVVVYDPSGWAVEFETTLEGEPEGFTPETLTTLTTTLPAPTYDPEEYTR